MERLKGSIVPLVTPYNEDLSIDFVTFRKLINWQIENGSHGISVAGSTGEMTLLSYEEKVKLFEVAVQEASGKVTVVASTGSSNLNETIALSKEAEKIGCDALLITVPYYSRPNQEGIFEYFKKVSESVSLPIIIYNIPARTGTNIEPKTLKRLKEKCKNIIGVKEANPNFDQMSKDILECGEDFLVYSGIESLCYPLLAIGGVGYLSATANLLPKELAKLYELAKEGKWEEARKLHYKLLPINEVLFIDTNPVPLKTAMGVLRMIKPVFRPPLAPLSEDKKAKLIEVLKLYFSI
jgi:4-hydroxy-tetrahydrodipicolinate synthase